MLHRLTEDRDRILDRLKARESDLRDYNYLQGELRDTDVTENALYRSTFVRFYQVRRDGDWQRVFFSILEREKNNRAISFGEVLSELFRTARHKGRPQIESSFSSKLVATVRPELPVYDSRVSSNLKLRTPGYDMTQENRMLRFINEVYPELMRQTVEMTQDSNFATLRRTFNATFPQYAHFTDVKKLDLFLWEYRP